MFLVLQCVHLYVCVFYNNSSVVVWYRTPPSFNIYFLPILRAPSPFLHGGVDGRLLLATPIFTFFSLSSLNCW